MKGTGVYVLGDLHRRHLRYPSPFGDSWCALKHLAARTRDHISLFQNATMQLDWPLRQEAEASEKSWTYTLTIEKTIWKRLLLTSDAQEMGGILAVVAESVVGQSQWTTADTRP